MGAAVVLAPKAGGIKRSDTTAARQLRYVDMDLGPGAESVPDSATILLDKSGRIIWSREGAMDPLVGRSAPGIYASSLISNDGLNPRRVSNCASMSHGVAGAESMLT
jgi:hypothetical protein